MGFSTVWMGEGRSKDNIFVERTWRTFNIDKGLLIKD